MYLVDDFDFYQNNLLPLLVWAKTTQSLIQAVTSLILLLLPSLLQRKVQQKMNLQNLNDALLFLCSYLFTGLPVLSETSKGLF